MRPGQAQIGSHGPQHIKLGVDVPIERYVVVRQIDGQAPPPPPSFTPVMKVIYS